MPANICSGRQNGGYVAGSSHGASGVHIYASRAKPRPRCSGFADSHPAKTQGGCAALRVALAGGASIPRSSTSCTTTITRVSLAPSIPNKLNPRDASRCAPFAGIVVLSRTLNPEKYVGLALLIDGAIPMLAFHRSRILHSGQRRPRTRANQGDTSAASAPWQASPTAESLCDEAPAECSHSFVRLARSFHSFKAGSRLRGRSALSSQFATLNCNLLGDLK
jgi:hypothetical protein